MRQTDLMCSLLRRIGAAHTAFLSTLGRGPLRCSSLSAIHRGLRVSERQRPQGYKRTALKAHVSGRIAIPRGKLKRVTTREVRALRVAPAPDFKIKKGKKDITSKGPRPVSRKGRFRDPDFAFGKKSLVYQLKYGPLRDAILAARKSDPSRGGAESRGFENEFAARSVDKPRSTTQRDSEPEGFGQGFDDTARGRPGNERGNLSNSRDFIQREERSAQHGSRSAENTRGVERKDQARWPQQEDQSRRYSPQDSPPRVTKADQPSRFVSEERPVGLERAREPRGLEKDHQLRGPPLEALGFSEEKRRPEFEGEDHEPRGRPLGAIGSRDEILRSEPRGVYRPRYERAERPERPTRENTRSNLEDDDWPGATGRPDPIPGRVWNQPSLRDETEQGDRGNRGDGGQRTAMWHAGRHESFGGGQGRYPDRPSADKQVSELQDFGVEDAPLAQPTSEPQALKLGCGDGETSPLDGLQRSNFRLVPSSMPVGNGEVTESNRPPGDWGTREIYHPRDARGNDMPIRVPRTTAASQFLYGRSVVEAALRNSRRQFYKMYIYAGEGRKYLSQDAYLEKLAGQNGVPIERLLDRDGLRMMDKMSGGRPHNNCVLEASDLPQLPLKALGALSKDPARPGFGVELTYQSREESVINGTTEFIPCRLDGDRNPFMILLEGILDPGNLGAILRTAAFLGATGVVISKGSSATLTPIALKASAGASEVIPLYSAVSTIDFIQRSKESGWLVYAAVAAGPRSRGNAHVTVDRIEGYDPLSTQPTILVMGSEGEGLSKLVTRAADFELSIPSPAGFMGGVDSLNVSVATGILCAAFLKKSRSLEIENTADLLVKDKEVALW